MADYVAKIDIVYPKKPRVVTDAKEDEDMTDAEMLEHHICEACYTHDHDFPMELHNGLVLKLHTKNKVMCFVNYCPKSNPEQYYHECLMWYTHWQKEDQVLSNFQTYEETFNSKLGEVKIKMAEYKPLSSVLDTAQEEFAQQDRDADPVVAPSMQYEDELHETATLIHQTSDNAANDTQCKTDCLQIDIGPYLGLPTVQDDPNNVHFVPNLLTDQEYYKPVMTLNRKQQEFHTHIMHEALQGSTQVLCALHGGAGTGKSTVIHAIYQGLYKLLNKKPGCYPNHQHVLIIAPTGKAAYNIHGTTIHRAFHIPANQKMEYRQLSWDNLNTLHKQFHGIQWILIDEFSMVGNHMLQFIYLHLQEIRGNKVPFGGINFVCVGDVFQLQPVIQQYIFMDLTSDYGPLATNLWKEHFTVFELTEIMWQNQDKTFPQLLNCLHIGEHTAADFSLLKMCIISQDQSLVMAAVLHFFPTRDCTTA